MVEDLSERSRETVLTRNAVFLGLTIFIANFVMMAYFRSALSQYTQRRMTVKNILVKHAANILLISNNCIVIRSAAIIRFDLQYLQSLILALNLKS